MGKSITVQKRGKGTTSYRCPSHRFKGEICFLGTHEGTVAGKIQDFIDCPCHSAPLMKVEYENGKEALVPAPEGVRVNDQLTSGPTDKISPGNVLPLKDIPEGTDVFNIELQPGDGGRFVRASGTSAKIVGKMGDSVIIRLPSRKERPFNKECRACIGVVAGGGRTEKPLFKAGRAFMAKGARNSLYPITSPNCMSAVAHPYGNTRSLRKSKTKPVSRNTPPGRKVGSVAARRTGRKKK